MTRYSLRIYNPRWGFPADPAVVCWPYRRAAGTPRQVALVEVLAGPGGLRGVLS